MVMVLYPLLQVDHISHVMAPVSNKRRYTSMTLCMVKLSMLGFYISIRCVMAFLSHGTWHTSKTLCIVRFEAVMVHHFVVREIIQFYAEYDVRKNFGNRVGTCPQAA